MPATTPDARPATYAQGNPVTASVISVLTFTLIGTPTAKGRPRFNPRTGRAYTPAKTRAAERDLLTAWRAAAGDRAPHTGPVFVEMVATFVPPTSWPKWQREAALAGTYPHVTKPDFDNLAKTLDALNGHAWVDDSRVVHASIRKQYGATASTTVTLTFVPLPERNRK